jgi:hypothetical protein
MKILTFKLWENLVFKKLQSKPGAKTDTYRVLKDDNTIGRVKWWSRVRGYGYLPPEEDEQEVKDFISDLMKKRREAKKNGNK